MSEPNVLTGFACALEVSFLYIAFRWSLVSLVGRRIFAVQLSSFALRLIEESYRLTNIAEVARQSISRIDFHIYLSG